jgi:predicted glycosyltransferase
VRVMNGMGHPAHMHCANIVGTTPTLIGGFFMNTIWELEKKGHQVKATAQHFLQTNKYIYPLTTIHESWLT